MTSDHETLRDLAAPYVLGTLGELERLRFAAHLETCPDCRRETREIASAFEHMAQTLTPAEPPADLRARVLSHVTAQDTDTAASIEQPAPARRAAAWPAWLAAAASLLAVLSGSLAWSYKRESAILQRQLTAAEQQLTAMNARITTLEAAADDAQQTSTILTAADLTRVDLAGQPPAPVASGRVFWSASHGLVFTATNLPPLPPGRVYQLWIVAEAPLSAGIVSPDRSGRLNVVTGTPLRVPAKAFALTIEPDGGRPAPTGPMFLLGTI